MLRHNNRLVSIVSLMVAHAALSLIIVQLGANSPYTKQNMAGIRSIQEKLDAFVADVTQRYAKIDYAELERVSEEYETLTDKEKDGRRSEADLRLVIDLAVAPFKENRHKKPAEYIETISQYYSAFKPAYMSGRQVFSRSHKEKTAKTDKLIAKLTKNWGEASSGEAVEMQDFETGKKEAKSLLEKMNNLARNGLIYNSGSNGFLNLNHWDNMDDFKSLVNFFNEAKYKPLFIYVYPSMDRPLKVKVETLISKYFKNLGAFGQRYIKAGSKPGRFEEGRGSTKQSSEAGFMHVL